MKFPKILEFFYSLSTNDKYSEWDSTKSFNRINKPLDELLYSHHNRSTTGLIVPEEDPNNPSSASLEGTHEVKLAWRHIKNWISSHNSDLSSSLLKPCTNDDLRDFQKDLNIKLPACVIEFFKLTDGQGNFGNDSEINGLIFGLKLLPLDEILINTEQWRKVAKLISNPTHPAVPLTQLESTHNNENQIRYNARASSSISLSNPSKSTASPTLPKLKPQNSIPPDEVLSTYAHPMWIPIITDEVGNYVGIDLLPPPNGKWGQVIIFGRDFDTKYKIADNFGDFLLLFANDLEIGNWSLRTSKEFSNNDLFIGNEHELFFIDKDTKLEQSYLNVLKNRSIESWVNLLESVTPEDKKILDDLTSKDRTFLKFKPDTIDKFINSNLSTIDPVNDDNNDFDEDDEDDDGISPASSSGLPLKNLTPSGIEQLENPNTFPDNSTNKPSLKDKSGVKELKTLQEIDL